MTVRTKNIVNFMCKAIASVLLLQTLFFKFSAAEESVYIFSKLGVEPWGRIASGVFELVASVLMLWPRTTAWGALLALGIMGGAILSHLLVLGISVQGDGGQLFAYAVLVLLSALVLVVNYRRQLGTLLPASLFPSK
ncbi:DoxX family protein [Flaviaesturariibacter amylovorans]|uniref:DoxX family protein n=1 Tax=Flaviaesturariibacter amylovorans TaxID=1084520 RepID=A0ABP8H754_9BACT